jgi:hypothetical protein
VLQRGFAPNQEVVSRPQQFFTPISSFRWGPFLLSFPAHTHPHLVGHQEVRSRPHSNQGTAARDRALCSLQELVGRWC